MSLSASYKTNVEKETKGVRVVKGVNETNKGEIAFNLSRSGKANRRYSTLLDNLSKPHRRAIELETLSPSVADQIYMQAFIGGCLNGWENVPLSDITGEVSDAATLAPFSKENAEKLFVRLPELYDDLVADSRRVALFRDEALEIEAKN
jgi:hypothetical protein